MTSSAPGSNTIGRPRRRLPLRRLRCDLAGIRRRRRRGEQPVLAPGRVVGIHSPRRRRRSWRSTAPAPATGPRGVVAAFHGLGVDDGDRESAIAARARRYSASFFRPDAMSARLRAE